jgi:glucose/mannose-6-phosphate isomerase
MLDDLSLVSRIDKSDMLGIMEGFPRQMREAKELVNASSLGSIYKIDNVVISGMGASSISGDIVKSLFREKINIPIYVSRQYDLPKWANKDTLLISQSYSGNTEETLSTFKYGCQKRCKIIGISTGGKLQEYCEKRDMPHIKIPEGLPPRCATGYILTSSIYALERVGMVKDIEGEIDESITISEDVIKKNKKEIPEIDNYSKQLAKKLLNTIPQVYGFNFYMPIARRWCSQFNENSKIICRYDEVPECNHNDIVGWSLNPDATKNFSCVLFRDEDAETIYLSKRLDFMRNLFENVAENVIEVKIKGKRRLPRMIYLMCLGDFVSCYLAILRNVDPTPVEAITNLKTELAKI